MQKHRTQAERKRRSLSYKKNRAKVLDLHFQKLGHYRCESCNKAPLRRNLAGESHSFHNTVTVDHIIDLSKGGTNELSNLRVICFQCNNEKSNSPKND